MADLNAAPKKSAKGSLEWRVIGLLIVSEAVLYLGARLLERSYAAPLLFGTPLVIGLLAGLLSARRPYSNAMVGVLLGLLLSIAAWREGVACVILSLPLLSPIALLATVVGVLIRRKIVSSRRRRQIGGSALLLCLAWQAAEGYLDDPAQHPVQRAEASIEIAAPPSAVFASLTARPLEVPQRWQWFLKLGLPMARRIAVLEPRVGGEVRMDLNFGVAHARITELEPSRVFAFAVERYEVHDAPFYITRLGRGPSYGVRAERVEDWLTILSTRYTFERTPSGGTRLSRRMVWRRHLFPGFYFEPLQQLVIGRGQQRLLELVRDTVEAEQASLSRGAVALAK